MTISIRDKVFIPLENINCEVEFITFNGLEKNKEHFAIIFNKINYSNSILVRIHSECITGDLFLSKRCDCGDQLNFSIKQLSEFGGILIYLRQEGRGIGLYEKISAYKLQDEGHDTFKANEILGHKPDERIYNFVPEILTFLGAGSIKLITNNPEKVKCFDGTRINVTEIINTPIFKKESNLEYLKAKQRYGHSIKI